jgi:protein involved in polysaccharide export with SLBB domain
MRYKSVKYLALLFACCNIGIVQAQFFPFPGMGMMGMPAPGSTSSPVDSSASKKPSANQPNGSNANGSQNGEKPKSKMEMAIDTIDQSVKKDELTLKRMSIAASRIRVEKELEELKGKENITEIDQELIRIKSENLKLLYEREKAILAEDLARSKSASRDFPVERIYGQQLFRSNNIKLLETGDQLAVPESYVLSTGDVIQLEVWGYRYWSQSAVIGLTGAIDIKGYQKLFLKGMTLSKARSYIASRLGLEDGNSSFSLTVTRPRTITVQVLGEVMNAGSVTVTAINSAFNILAYMGGPSNLGTIRNIYIKRNGLIVDTLDVYRYSSDGKEIYLQNQDAIIVPASGKVISVEGGVMRPGNYELKPGEKFSDLVRFGGGLDPVAYTRNILITRISDEQTFERISINYDSLRKAGKDFDLKNGDVVSFKTINDDYKDYMVKVNGAVNIPGDYKIRKGDRISKILKLSNGLLSTAYPDKAFLIRNNVDLTRNFYYFSPADVLKNPGTDSDLVLEERDEIKIFSRQELRDQFVVRVEGEVRVPQQTDFVSGMRVSELLFMGGGLKENAEKSRAFLLRVNEKMERKLVSFSPQEVLANPGGDKDPLLEPRDIVKIFSVTAFKEFYKVVIEGAVRSPNTFDFSTNMRISDLLYLGGGLKEGAFLDRAILTRIDPYYLIETNTSLNLREIIDNPGSEKDLILEPRDELRIFNRLEMRDKLKVTVSGQVRKPGEYDYSDDLSLKDLIYLAGGFTYAAANAKIEIVRQSAPIDPVYWIPTKTLVYTTTVPVDLSADRETERFKLVPFDQIFVRTNPDYVPIKVVELKGAVMFPGGYTLMGNGEKLTSVIRRAGGLKPEAFPEGASFYRKQSDSSEVRVVLDLQKALSRKRSAYNYTLKNGDVIEIPFAEELVVVDGAINMPDKTTRIGSYYVPGKRAGYYIRNLAGGFREDAYRRKVTVTFKNGRVSQSKNFVLFKIYPKVSKGAFVNVPTKPTEEQTATTGRKRFNLDNTLNSLITRTMSLFSFIAMIRIATSWR